MDNGQTIFVYASVAASELEAGEIVQRIVKDASVQGELKAAKLLRFNGGRRAIESLARELNGRFLISIFDKKFSLACKFFEYVFEPALAARNSFFYRIRFHKFIANLLYVHFVAKKASAEEIFDEFERAMRELDEARLHRLLLEGASEEEKRSLKPIADFGILNFDVLKEEIAHLRGHNVGKWILDLTASALYSHLGSWGDRFDELEVYCDSSKPIYEGFPLDAFVGQTEKVYTDISGEEHLLTPRLAKPIELLDSKQHAGLQIADVLAGAAARIVIDRSPELERIRPHIIEGISRDSVVPQPDEYLSRSSLEFHAPILGELVRRSRVGEPLLDRFEELLSPS